MQLWDLMDKDLFREMLLLKYIRINEQGKFRIINYTESAQFDKVWNSVTKQSRGLIIDENWNVVARPFDKFFNYGEYQADKLLMDYRVEVTDKMDGSLGILFGVSKIVGAPPLKPDAMGAVPAVYQPRRIVDTWHVATKGSMVSEQACMMQDILNDKYSDVIFDTAWTYMFEIIYPGNRIVLDYGDTVDLFLLGARHIESGIVRPAAAVSEWPGPKTQTFSYKTLTEALEASPRPNAEGFVVYFPELDYRVKIKQDDYVALHKIVTGLTERRIWENLVEGKTLGDLAEIVPDEWHGWLEEVFIKLDTAFRNKVDKIYQEYGRIIDSLPKIYTRKDFAQVALSSPLSSFMFLLYDGKDITGPVWKTLRPEAE